MNEFRVTCVIRSPADSPNHRHITHIGGAGGWTLSKNVVVSRIDAGSEAYFTVDKATGKKAYIKVVRESGQEPYIRTIADGLWSNNLVELPSCGSD